MDPIDRLPLPRRHLALLLFISLVPSGVLTALAVRTWNQDRELAVRREEDQRRQLAVAIRQEFLGRLEGLKVRALSGEAGSGNAARDPTDPIVLLARVEDGQLLLPWEGDAAPAEARRVLGQQPFAGLVSRGETTELVDQRPLAAATHYRRALASSRGPIQEAAAELLVGRAFGKAGRGDDALSFSRRSLDRQLSLVDEHGVPFALYAARRMADLDVIDAADARGVLEVIRQFAEIPWVPPAAGYMAAAVVARFGPKAPPEIQSLVSAVEQASAAQLARTEQALALQQTFPALARQLPPAGEAAKAPMWLPFGRGPWLIGLSASLNNHHSILVVVDAQKAFAGLESATRCQAAGGCQLALVSETGPDDYPLGAALPGMRLTGVTRGDAGEIDRSGAQRWFYLAALSLVVALAGLGAYLLWRDVRRELRVAELRSQFVSSVSHELKTPLTAIRMFAETLRMGRPTEPAVRDEYLDTIVNESERLTRLLNNVLDFSRIERGRKSYQFAPHDLAAIVRTAARAMHYPLAQQGFELLNHVDENVPLVRSDPDALEQAILNLLANALKYSGDARRIELRLTRDDTHALISVRDWGIGIATADQRHIFERFYRVGTPENRRIPGTGLGLTLVDHIVRSHGGFVLVNSAPGAGSTFEIHLPLTEGAAVASDAAHIGRTGRPAQSEV